MRLGDHKTSIQSNTLAHDVYGQDTILERHRHRYEVNPRYMKLFEHHGLLFTGQSDNRMEILELNNHPFFLGTQFHPEFRSRPGSPSPPFLAFLDAVRDHQQNNSTPTDVSGLSETN